VIKHREVRVFAITALVNVTAFLLGPIVGVAVLFLTSSSLAVIDIIGSLVYAVVMPYAGIAIALLFYDLRRRHQEAPAVSPTAIAAPTASH
jgi:ABC-type multidrug transport system fused ATPase/permease subunit